MDFITLDKAAPIVGTDPATLLSIIERLPDIEVRRTGRTIEIRSADLAVLRWEVARSRFRRTRSDRFQDVEVMV